MAIFDVLKGVPFKTLTPADSGSNFRGVLHTFQVFLHPFWSQKVQE